jgi:hypothetical protein
MVIIIFIIMNSVKIIKKKKNTVHTQKNGAVSEVYTKIISHPILPQHTLSAARTAQVSHALLTVLFSFLLRGRGTCFRDDVVVGEGVLCAPF